MRDKDLQKMACYAPYATPSQSLISKMLKPLKTKALLHDFPTNF